MVEGSSIIKNVAGHIGLSTDMFLIAVTLFSGYLFALLHRITIRKYSVEAQYLYFITCGVVLFLFNYGVDIFHSFICILLAYILLQTLGGTLFSVILAFIIFMGYLLVGYYFTAQGDYDLTWSLPQCVLTLKLIGLVWDVYDGQQHEKKLSEDQKKTALKDKPGFLEIYAYSYFFSAFLVGPQFPLTRLRSLVKGEFNDPASGLPRKNWWQCLHRLVLSCVYMAIYIQFYNKLPTEFFLTDKFKEEHILWKCWHACVWVRLLFCQYLACWLAVEGSCILIGLAYNGQDPKTNVALWDGLRNIRTTKFELGCTFQSVIESFNTNTNQWASRYVFKRLKFLGNKSLSHVLTLLFLAIWHGMYSGYIACFLFEYVCVVAERQVTTVVKYLPKVERLLNLNLVWYPSWLVKKFLITFGCAYGLLPFALLKFDIWWQVYKDFYFCGWLLYGVVWQLFFALFSFFISNDGRLVKRQHED